MKNYDVAIVGCGFIGSSLAKYLHGFYSVTTFDITSQPKWLSHYKIPHKVCDITDFQKLSSKLGNPLVVIHTVALSLPQTNNDKQLAYDADVLGIQNICEAVLKNSRTRGMILTSSWHVFGEHDLRGNIDEGFGYRPDKVEDVGRPYTILKILQECIVRFYDEKTPNKFFGSVRLGTVLGEHMGNGTAANLFINQALEGKNLTPFKHSMHRPMLYVTMEDISKSFKSYVRFVIKNEKNQTNSIDHVINLAYPDPITILDLANIIVESVRKYSKGKIHPKISVVDKDIPSTFDPADKNSIKIDITKARKFFKFKKLTPPKKAINKLVQKRLAS